MPRKEDARLVTGGGRYSDDFILNDSGRLLPLEDGLDHDDPALVPGSLARAGEDVTAELAGPSTGSGVPAHSIARIVMGDAIDDITRAGQRNRDEGRIVMIQAVFERQ